MAAIGEEMLAALRDTYLFSYFTGSVEELSSDQLIQVYLRLLNVFDSNYDMESSDGKQLHEPNVSSGSALKHILRCLRSMELFHLVGSSKPSQLYDKKTSLRLLSALHDKITARHGSKTAHRVRIVVKADKLPRRERKKPPQDRLSTPDDAPAPERQDKENLDSCLAGSASAVIPVTLIIKEEVDVDHWETRGESDRTRASVSSQEILKEVDRGASHPLRTGELPVLLVPKKGRELARTPVRPQTSADKEGCDDDSEDLVSSPSITMKALAPPAHIQTDSTSDGTRAQSSEQKPTTADTKVSKHPGDISNDLSLPSTTLNVISLASQVGEVIMQPQSSVVSPMPQIPCFPTNMANVRKSVAPILSGGHVLELPLTPVSTPVSEDRNVIPSGRQIARTPVAPPGDDPSLEDSSLTPVIKDEMSDVSVILKTEHVHRINSNDNKTLEGKSSQDSNESSSAKRLKLKPADQTDYDSTSDENPNSITAGFRNKASVNVTSPNVTVADPTFGVKSNNLVSNTLIGSPIVKKLLTRQESSPLFVPFRVDKGKKRPGGNCTISSVDSADAKDGAKVVPCQPELGSNSMLTSADENDITASPSVCRDPPLINDTLEMASEGYSNSVDIGNIILKPPPGFDSSCPSDRGDDEFNSSNDLGEPLASETCIETRRKFPGVSFAEKGSPDHLAVQKCNKDKTYNIEATKNYEDKRKTFVLSKAVFDSSSNLRRTTFVVPQNVNCVSASNLNTHDCKRRTFVVPPDEIASNTLTLQANESRELVPSPGMSAVAFGELTLLPKDVGETFLVDQSVSNTQECSTGHLALSSTDEESSYCSDKVLRSDSERSEEAIDAHSTPPSNRGGPGNVNHVPRGRQLYRTPVTGLGKNEVTGGTEHADDCSSGASEDDFDNQAIEHENERAEERLSSISEFLAEDEVGTKTNVETSGVEREESNVVGKSVIHEKDAGALVKVSSALEKDLTYSDLDETLSNESRIKPVKFEVCKYETYVKDSTIKSNGSPKVEKSVLVADEPIGEAAIDVNNAIKTVVQDMEDSCDLDDSGNSFTLVKKPQVKRNLPVEKRSRGAGNKGVKRSRKDSIEHLLIKQLKAEHLLSPLNSQNDLTGRFVRNTKKESSPSIPKRGRKKKEVNAVTDKEKSKTSSAVSKTPVKAEETDALIDTVVHSICDREGKLVPNDGTSTRGVERDEESVNIPRPHRGKKTAQPTNPALDSVLDENAGSNEAFDELKADQNSRKVTKGGKIVINRKVAHTYSREKKGNQTNAPRKKSPLSKLIKKHSSDEMVADPQKSIESDDLINELPENSMRRPRRQRVTKVVDYNESPFVTPTLPPLRGRRGGSAKCSRGTLEDGASDNSDTHEPENIFDTPQTSEILWTTGTTDRDNLECSNDANEIVSNDISRKDSGDSNDWVNFKQPTRRGRVRGRGGRNGPLPVMSATKSNAVTRGRSSKHTILVNTNDTSDVLETVSREAKLTKRGAKFPASALDGRTGEEHKSPALREGAVTHSSKGRGKKATAFSKTRKDGNTSASPEECILEVLAPSSRSRTGACRGRVRTSAKQGKGRGADPIASKSGQLEEFDSGNGDIVEEVLENEHEEEKYSDKVSLSSKKIARGRIPAPTKAAKNKRSTVSVNKVTSPLSLSPRLPDGTQSVNEEHDTPGEILPEKRSRRGKRAISKGSNDIKTIAAAKTKDDRVQKKRTAVISKTKTTTKSKVQKSASAELESEFVEAETLSAAPKRKWGGTNREEHDDESPNKKIRQEALKGRSGEVLGTVDEEVSNCGSKITKANKTKAQAVKSSRKVNFESSASISTGTGQGSSKSEMVTEGTPAAVLVSKTRATRDRAGRAAAK